MTSSHSYEKELEHLILDTLLPVYERYQKSKGIRFPLDGLNDRILKQIVSRKRLPALLRPKEKHT